MAAHGLTRYQRFPTRPLKMTSPAQKKIQTMYSDGLYRGLAEPNRPEITTATRPRTPIVPPTRCGHRERAAAVSHRTGRRGYCNAFAPTWSPANRTTSTNEMTTTPAAAYR